MGKQRGAGMKKAVAGAVAAAVLASSGPPVVPGKDIPDAPAPAYEKKPEVRSVAPGFDVPEPTDDLDAAQQEHEAFIALCRKDIHTFVEYVLKEEETGENVEQAPMHLEMHAIIEQHRRLVVTAHPESGKTSQFIARIVWMIGNNLNARFAIIGKTQSGAKKALFVIKQLIEKSPEVRAVFPNLLPGEKWTEDAITVQRPFVSKDQTIQCLGVLGDVIGSRLDGVMADDLLDEEYTCNETQRKKLSRWWNSTVMTRLTARAWVAFLCNSWHPQDLAHELEARGWPTKRYPVMDSRGRSTWPSRWPMWRIEERRRDMTSELEFARMYLCQPRDEGAVVFLPEALERCKANGRGYELVPFLDAAKVPPGAIVVTGVDLAVTKRMTGAVTSFVTLFIHPNGMRQVIGMRSGRWGARQILRVMKEVADSYGGYIVVEDNAAQKYLVEIAQEAGDGIEDIQRNALIVPFTTGKNKQSADMGIDSMAAEMEAGRWVIPVGLGKRTAGNALYMPEREVSEWLAELAVYDPSAHAGDRLMASWMARTYALRVQRVRRSREEGKTGVNARVIGGRPLPKPQETWRVKGGDEKVKVVALDRTRVKVRDSEGNVVPLRMKVFLSEYRKAA